MLTVIQILAAAICACVITATSVGLGKHQLRVNAEDPNPPSYNRISLQVSKQSRQQVMIPLGTANTHSVWLRWCGNVATRRRPGQDCTINLLPTDFHNASKRLHMGSVYQFRVFNFMGCCHVHRHGRTMCPGTVFLVPRICSFQNQTSVQDDGKMRATSSAQRWHGCRQCHFRFWDPLVTSFWVERTQHVVAEKDWPCRRF